jgi:hypothetical protein
MTVPKNEASLETFALGAAVITKPRISRVHAAMGNFNLLIYIAPFYLLSFSNYSKKLEIE